MRNQDYELNWRLRQRGETVWFDPKIAAECHPCGSMTSLVRKYFNYGWWKSAMLMLHPHSLQVRHLVAPLLVLGLAASPGLAISGALWWAAVIGHREPSAILLPVVLMAMRLSWGSGFFLPHRLS